jgi:hypothetical protein
MRYVCLAAVAALSVLAPSAAFGQLSITNYQFVSQQSATSTKSDFTYRADVVNAGGPLGSVTATLTSPGSVHCTNGAGARHAAVCARAGQQPSPQQQHIHNPGRQHISI